MREIKFRGIRKADGTWSYGDLIHGDDGIYVMARDNSHMNSPDFDEVIPETVGQYIGRADDNGVDIYHGDLIEMYKERYSVGYHPTSAMFLLDKSGEYSYTFGALVGFTVIGNIHQNPELL